MIDVALMGCGRWGSRLMKILAAHPRMRLCAVIETADPDRLGVVPSAPLVKSLSQVDVDAVFIATPSVDHAAHVQAALDQGMDVFVEKPFVQRRCDADVLCDRVAAGGRIGMVGHVLRFHPLVCDFVERIRGGAVGRPQQFHARRFTSSGSPDPLWTLGPHDLSTLRAIDDSEVIDVQRHRLSGAGDALSLELASGLSARLEVSTTAAFGQRRTVVEGSTGRIELDELHPGAEAVRADPQKHQLDHFVDCVEQRSEPRTSFRHARFVVDILERA